MNIIKLQDQLKGVPDQSLIGYVQNPTGEVPSYLALGELQRRKTMREKYDQQQAPQTTVAEDLATPPQPQGLAAIAPQGAPQMPPALAPQEAPQGMADGGVASLDTGDMYDEANYATGGIVSFAGPEGSYVLGADQDYTDDYRALREYESLQGLRDKYPDMEKTSAPKVRSPYDDAIDYYRSIRNQSSLAFDKGVPGVDKALGTLLDRKEAWLSGKKDPFTKEDPVGSKYNPQGIYTPKGVQDKINVDKSLDESIKNLKIDSKVKPKVDRPIVDKPLIDRPLIDKKTKPVSVLPDYMEDPAKNTAESQIARLKAIIGDNPNAKALQDKLGAMESRAAKQESMAPWMALTEAGFNMAAGTSPYAVTNIGTGAVAGLKSYGAAQDKLAALEEKRYALMSEAAKADRAEQVAIASKGFESEDAYKARAQKDRIANMNAELEREKLKVTERVAKAKINSDANLIRQANLGMKDQAAIDKYVKDKMGTSAVILNTLRGIPASKLTPERKTALDNLIAQEKKYIQEAEGKYDINALRDRGRGNAPRSLVDDSNPLGLEL